MGKEIVVRRKLLGAMAEFGITKQMLAQTLNISRPTLFDKMSGAKSFIEQEILELYNIFGKRILSFFQEEEKWNYHYLMI